MSRSALISEFSAKKPLAAETIGRSLTHLTSIYASDALTHSTLKSLISSSAYKEFVKVLNGAPLTLALADVLAQAMKEWAIARGATHYAHLFFPLTNVSAEKHDSFLDFDREGTPIMAFTGKQLIKGEPDASSFPSGGLRATCEARGYTVVDLSSPVYLKDSINGKTLIIPTAFCSWSGEALDKKTPLLRSVQALSKEAVKLLRALGDDKTTSVYTTVGGEQEFFMIDRSLYLARPDLVLTGRTLIGAKPPKTQELEEHYFGNMPQRVQACLQEVEDRMWRLGVPVKTRHNEVAPSQFEIAPIFEAAPMAIDHNIISMDLLREVAQKHGLVCLLHEKPFAYVNGSGKHNNLSFATNLGENLLDPTDDPRSALRFIVVLTAIIRAFDLHADLVRAAIASPGNDHRLGANEAPPAIMSAFLGAQLEKLCIDIMEGNLDKPQSPESTHIELGVTVLPPLPRDPTDRNRTSPFAFTGNKFEFRAAGSSQSLDVSTWTINTIVAESFGWMAEQLSARFEAKKDQPQNKVVQDFVAEVLRQHFRVCFGGNGYSAEWVTEAAKRGLANIPNGPAALLAYEKPENQQLFAKFGVMSVAEVQSRSVIFAENFLKHLNIEVRTLADLVKTRILPAAVAHQQQLAASFSAAVAALPAHKDLFKAQEEALIKVAKQIAALHELVAHVPEAHGDNIHEELAQFHKEAFAFLNGVRAISDDLESTMDDKLWPLPKYSELLLLLGA